MSMEARNAGSITKCARSGGCGAWHHWHHLPRRAGYALEQLRQGCSSRLRGGVAGALDDRHRRAEASSMSRSVVSSTWASSAALSRAVARLRIALVPAQDVGEHLRLVDIGAGRAQLGGAPARPRLGGGGDEDLHLGIGKDDRADVAAVEHRAGRRTAEAALEREQCCAPRGPPRPATPPRPSPGP